MPSQTVWNHWEMNHFWNSSLIINHVSTLITSRGIHLHHQKAYKTRTVWPLLPFYVEFIWKKNIVAIRSWYKPFSLINCRATSCWNFSKLSKSSFMWKSMRKGRPSSVSSCTESKRQDSFLPFPKYTSSDCSSFQSQRDLCFSVCFFQCF